jgi:SOS-response transcriptional repressor LexA
LGRSEPKLWLAAEDELTEGDDEDKHAHFPVTTCTTCGQHYFISFLKDFEFSGRRPGGGDAAGNGSFWEPLEESLGGCRVILTDRIVGGSDDEDIEENERTATLHYCHHCGAAHPADSGRCLHCGATGEMVTLYALRQKKDNPGFLSSCISCGATGRRMGTRYREPARAVRATNVADVHVLAQDMVHHAERPRLLVFCDNRQDAAFQAGWMKDHARRFRLRALMADGMTAGPASVGDLTHHVDEILSKDESLSRALVPEVWQVVRREGSGGRHEQERRKFLRIQVLREVTLSSRQPIGLEPWGRMKVDYDGLAPGLPWIQANAMTLGLPAEELVDGVASVLDYLRRRRALYDPEREIFSKYWMDGDLEIQQGYMPQQGGPVGTKLRREATEKAGLVTQWLSGGGDTTMRQIARKWGVPADDLEPFLEGLFGFLVDKQFLRPVTLKGSRGNALPGISGIYQVDADKLRMRGNHGVWRCRSCRRTTTRRTPHQRCPAWRCDGELEFRREDPDNYNLQLLDEAYAMLRPEEHTAMVPHDERERLENLFKGSSDAVNCFVCTPTLEMGVDIGALDAILMRNVPPLPANYWQRAGRAGRRHRMAVDMTYCRPVSHDRAYFAEPLKLLGGRVDPPAFNLRNDLMVAKHVHATVITRLHQYTRDDSRTDAERERIDGVVKSCLPRLVSRFLFDDANNVRTTVFDFTPLDQLIKANRDDLVAYVAKAFHQGWPAKDAEVTTLEALRAHVDGTVSGLIELVGRLRRRLKWAMAQMARLNRVREQQGALEPADDALFKRCDRLVKRLKGTDTRGRREAEGYDDVNTFGVLAAEGFLPGYGLEVGSILGTAEIPFWRTGAMEFVLPRPPSVALREYVPGNLIYANGNRFVARLFHRDVDEQRIEMPHFEVSTANQAVKETNALAEAAGLGGVVLPAIAVCDVDLVHQSHISDEEELRFQLGVAVYGLERDQHNGGNSWRWGEQPLHHRKGVRLRLVNVGASSALERHQRFGYPVCTVCGQSVSSLSSEKQKQHFAEDHTQRCGRAPDPVGFYADVVADAISLPACANPKIAYSVLESLRMAASHVLDMHIDDLQVLVIGHVDADHVDALLWDPMPGGSGLLDQMLERWSDVVAAAREIVMDCPAACESSCIDCLQSFRNGFYHKHLDRHLAAEQFDAWGGGLVKEHTIPPKQPMQEPAGSAQPVNAAEQRLRQLLLAAGFGEGQWQQQLKLDNALGTTTPDVMYRADHHEEDEGVCIYLDGLSKHLHGNPETAERDREIRSWLRGNGYDVIEIAVSDLHDQPKMTQHFRRLAGCLRNDALRAKVRDNSEWFSEESYEVSSVVPFTPRRVEPTPEEMYVTCVPMVPLKAAAGAFGDPQNVNPGDWEWVAVSGGRLRQGMFIAQVVGKSMEPKIPDGSWCLFASPVAGTRQGKIVLVELTDVADPESGERYTVKRYRSEKVEETGDSWRHLKITLEPLNRDFAPIELTCEHEGDVRVVAEFVEVL